MTSPITSDECADIARGTVLAYLGQVCPPETVENGSRMPINVLEMLLSMTALAIADCSIEEEALAVLGRAYANVKRRQHERDAHATEVRVALQAPTVGPMQ